LAAALHTIYDWWGFWVLSTKWYSNLRTNMQLKLEAVLAIMEESIFPSTNPTLDNQQSVVEESVALVLVEVPEAANPGGTPVPTCFGLETWGQPLSEGSDVQLDADGCFSYCHLRSAGDGPISYDPSYFISKEKIDTIWEQIATTWHQKPALTIPLILQEAIDACEASWDAANKKSRRFFSYAILTLQANARNTLSDLWRSSPFSVKGFWVCQMVYSPCLQQGLGLTDAKGVEQFWSHIHKLIGITSNQWIWTIDQYAAFVNHEGRENLGDWIDQTELCCNWEAQKAAKTSVRSQWVVFMNGKTLIAQLEGGEKPLISRDSSLPGVKFHIPSPLSTQLHGLQDDPSLHQDVWITPNPLSMVTWVTKELSIVAVAIERLTESPTLLETPAGTVLIEPESEEDIFSKGFFLSDAMATSSTFDTSGTSSASNMMMLANPDTPEDSTAVEAGSLNFEIRWDCMPNLSVDTDLLQCLQEHNNLIQVDPNRDKCVIIGTDGQPNVEMEASDIALVESHTGCLIGFVINGLAAAFLNLLGNPFSPDAPAVNQCAVFSPHPLKSL
ncbi:hypothetical protein B0H17DRAFT_1154190, partial [Mycena rosella]